MLTSAKFLKKSIYSSQRERKRSNISCVGYSNVLVSGKRLFDCVHSIFLVNFPAFFELRLSSCRETLLDWRTVEDEEAAFCFCWGESRLAPECMLLLEQLSCIVSGARRFWGVYGIIIKSCSSGALLTMGLSG